MEQKSTSIFVTKLRERKDKNGQTYFIGSLGLATVMLRHHKSNADEWNMFMMESKKKEQSGPPGSYSQSGGGYGGPNFNTDDEIPF